MPKDASSKASARVIEHDGWRCVACDKRCDLTVDHIKTRGLYPRLRWDPLNCTTLCNRCHEMKTAGIIRLERLADGSLRITRPGDA